MPLILPGRWMAVPCASSAAAAAMDLLSAGELAALDQTDSAESANPLDSLGEAPATAPPLWRAEAHAWTPRAHALAVQAAAGPVCFSFIPLPDADAVLSADVELPAQYRAVRAGGCAVRAEAALDSEPAGRIAAGEQVTVTERVELAAAAGADDDGSTRGAVVRLRTEHGWVSELSKKRHPLMIPFHEEPPEDDIASLPALKAAGTIGPHTLVWSSVMAGSFDGWQTLETCEQLLLVAAGVPCPPPPTAAGQVFDATTAGVAGSEQQDLERTASIARAEFTASTVSEDQVDVLSTFFSKVDKSLKGRFRTGTVEAILEDRRGPDGSVSPAEWELVCAELTEKYGENPMEVWREAGVAGGGEGSNDPLRGSGGRGDGAEADAAGMAAAGWRYYYRDPGGNPLDVLSGNAKGSILAASVVGLGEDQLTVMGSQCLKVDVEGGSTGSVIIRLSSLLFCAVTDDPPESVPWALLGHFPVCTPERCHMLCPVEPGACPPVLQAVALVWETADGSSSLTLCAEAEGAAALVQALAPYVGRGR